MLKYKSVTLLLIILIVLFSNIKTIAVTSDSLYQNEINLKNSYLLEIKERNDIVRIVLYKNKNLIKGIDIGNAGIRDDLIKQVELDGNRENGKEIFITVYDKDSTYGAQTNIVLWKQGIHWNMQSAPFLRGFIIDVNQDDIFEIVDYYPEKNIYIFRDGLFINIENLKV